MADEEDRRKTEGLSEIEVTTSTAPWKPPRLWQALADVLLVCTSWLTRPRP